MSHFPDERDQLQMLFGPDSDSEWDATVLHRERYPPRVVEPMSERQLDVSANPYRDHLEAHGQVAIPLALDAADAYIDRLVQCYDAWFQALLRDALGARGTQDFFRRKHGRKRPTESTRKKDARWEAGREEWLRHTPEHQQSVLQLLTLLTPDGRKRVMNMRKRTQFSPYLCDQVRWALNGGSASNQGPAVGRSVAKNGFGIGVYLHHTIMVTMVEEVRRLLDSQFGVPSFCTGRPELLFKVGGGEELKMHHDHQRPYGLLLDCIDNVHLSPPFPNHQWAQQHGVQTLVHLKGAKQSDGSTYTLSHMNPWRMLVCLLLLHHRCPHPDIRLPAGMDLRSWWEAPGSDGPVFFDWRKHLRVVNRVVQWLDALRMGKKPSRVPEQDRQWLGKLRAEFQGCRHHHPVDALLRCTSNMTQRSIRVKPIESDGDETPYVAIWLAGFFHGSLSASTDRITVVPHLGTTPSADVEKIVSYQEKIAEYADAVRADDVAAQERIQQWWTRYRTPEQGGMAHRRVETELELTRGAFLPLAPTTEDAAVFRRMVLPSDDDNDVIYRPIRMPHPGYPWTVVSIRAPWVQMMADGTMPLVIRPAADADTWAKPGTWVALHHHPAPAETVSTHYTVHDRYRKPGPWPYTNHIVAIARVETVLPTWQCGQRFAPWVQTEHTCEHAVCVVWDCVMKLHESIPFAGDTEASQNPEKQLLARGRRRVAKQLEEYLRLRKYTMVHPAC